MFQEQDRAQALNVRDQTFRRAAQVRAMPEPAEDVIVHNLIDALERLREELDRVELWAAALGHFQDPIPDYQPGNDYTLPPAPMSAQP
jgi:hypothetical protein